MENKYCINCMKQLGDSPVCRHCGWDNSKPHQAEPYHLTPGTLLAGRYLVGKALGEGGFGITYIGLHTTLSKRVAIKEFYPAGAANRTSQISEEIIITKDKQDFFRKGVERFLNEAKNVASFPDEDAIVDVVDYFQENNTAYIVMEYIEGLTLKDYTHKNGLFRPDQLIELMLPLMKSLSVIHAQGIIHRDISPDNIMFTKRGKLKLMDFGSARYFTNEDRQMSIILKQGFAPEEQYRTSSHQGPYTDVYALCATIYACITGRVPINSLERLAQDTLQRPSQLGVVIRPQHEDALMHGLAVRAQDRTPNMETLMRELTAAGTGYRTTSAPPMTAVQPPYMTQQQVYPTQASFKPPQTGNNAANKPPQKKKSSLPLVLGITIPAVVIAAVIIIVAIALSSGNKPSPVSSVSIAASSEGVSADSKGLSDMLSDLSSDTSKSSSKTSSASSGTKSTTQEGFSAEQAQQYPNELAAMMASALPEQDDKASSGDVFQVTDIYYCDSVDSDYVRMVFVYYNQTAKYYRAVQIDPTCLSVSGKAVKYNSGYYSFSDAADTVEKATENNRLLSKNYRQFYNITEVMRSGSGTASGDSQQQGLTAADAKKYSKQLSDMMLKKLPQNDKSITPGDELEINNIYYVEKSDEDYKRLVFIVHDITAGYYHATEISPEYVTVNNGVADYSIPYYSNSDDAKTPEQAKQNNFYLNEKYSSNYEITTIQ